MSENEKLVERLRKVADMYGNTSLEPFALHALAAAALTAAEARIKMLEAEIALLQPALERARREERERFAEVAEALKPFAAISTSEQCESARDSDPVETAFPASAYRLASAAIRKGSAE